MMRPRFLVTNQAPLTALVLCAASAFGMASPALAQYAEYPAQQYAPAAPVFSQAELDRMLAPIALYPDPLLSQILMAATYPIEVQEAARWLRSNPGLAGNEAVRLAAQSNWDPSVQSLTAFPQILFMMDENIEWTESLGEAFLAQQPYVMDTVQSLRQRAWAAGTLRSNAYMIVRVQGPYFFIEPAQPQIVYVPYYDPLVVYGPWWHPAYPPVRWRPWPGYARPGVSVGFYWGPAVTVSAGIFFGRFDWERRHVNVVHEYVPRPGIERLPSAPRVWTYAPEHRRGQPYRHEEVRRRLTTAPAQPQQQGPWDKAQQQQGPWDRAQQQQRAIVVPETRRSEPRPESRPRSRDERPQAQQPIVTPEARRSETRRSETRPESRSPEARPRERDERGRDERSQAQQPAQARAAPSSPVVRVEPRQQQREPGASAGTSRATPPAPPQARPEQARPIARIEERREPPRREARPQNAPGAPAASNRSAEQHQDRGRGKAAEQHGRGEEHR